RLGRQTLLVGIAQMQQLPRDKRLGGNDLDAVDLVAVVPKHLLQTRGDELVKQFLAVRAQLLRKIRDISLGRNPTILDALVEAGNVRRAISLDRLRARPIPYFQRLRNKLEAVRSLVAVGALLDDQLVERLRQGGRVEGDALAIEPLQRLRE